MYWQYVAKVSQSGYRGEPSPRVIAAMRVIMSFWRWLQVGKTVVINGHYLETPGPLVVCAGTHSTMLDGPVVMPLMERFCRCIGAHELFAMGFGLVGIFMSKVGVIPVDRKHGLTVLAPAIDEVSEGGAVGLFAEGKISPTGELIAYKPGVAMIALSAFERLGGKQSVKIVVLHLCYGKRDADSAMDYFKAGFKWRGGITVTVLPPFDLAEMSEEERTVENIVCRIRQAIVAIECKTATYPKNPCGD
jgi:1-acyl-sn-glycerol-3-phosphate acyltransferase